jgi:hypothetical protein
LSALHSGSISNKFCSSDTKSEKSDIDV